MKRHFAALVFLAGLLSWMAAIPLTDAQSRMNDKDIQSMMKNLQEDAKTFRSVFDSAVAQSTIRKTSQEKDAKALVGRFQKQTGDMLNQFKS